MKGSLRQEKEQRSSIAKAIFFDVERMGNCQTVCELDTRFHSLVSQASLLYQYNVRRLLRLGKFD